MWFIVFLLQMHVPRCEVVLGCLERFSSSEVICSQAILAVGSLVLNCEKNAVRLATLGACRLIRAAIYQHNNSYRIAAYTCRALSGTHSI